MPDRPWFEYAERECPACFDTLRVHRDDATTYCGECRQHYLVDYDYSEDAPGQWRDCTRLRPIEGPNGADEAGDAWVHRNR